MTDCRPLRVRNYDNKGERPCWCENCGWTGPEGTLEHGGLQGVPDLDQRLTAGTGTVPAGECPECGALPYLDTAYTRARQRLDDMFSLVRTLADVVNRGFRENRGASFTGQLASEIQYLGCEASRLIYEIDPPVLPSHPSADDDVDEQSHVAEAGEIPADVNSDVGRAAPRPRSARMSLLRYVISDGWEYPFVEAAPALTRWVFDRRTDQLIHLHIQHEGRWIRAKDSDYERVELSLVTGQRQVVAEAEEWGCQQSDRLPPWVPERDRQSDER